MMFLGCLLLAITLIVLYFFLPGGTAWKKYLAEVESSFRQEPVSEEPQMITEEAIEELPPLLQKYLKKNGYVNQPLMQNMFICFGHTRFRIAADKAPIPIEFCQVNFVERPDRYAFLKARMFGLPIQVTDQVQNGRGAMIGVLAKHFKLFHSTGPEMDQGQLITSLADAVFLPSLVLQDYVAWRTLDERTIEGTIRWNGVSAKGRFTFDVSGDIVRFDTEDRYMDENGKGTSLVPWFVLYENYKSDQLYRRPGCVSVNWKLPEGIDNYFVSDQIQVNYSVDLAEIKQA